VTTTTETEESLNSLETTFRRRHSIFKYGQNWYGNCGICTRPVWSQHWSGAFGLLTIHVQEHQPLTEQPPSE
jgi:hypothetical protein